MSFICADRSQTGNPIPEHKNAEWQPSMDALSRGRKHR